VRVTSDPVVHLADQIGRLLTRSNRAALYDGLTESVDGVTATTYPVLSGLARTGPTSVTRLAAVVGMDRTVVTKYAAQLHDAGLLSRTTGTDRRSTELHLTDAGTAAVAVMRARLHDVLRAATGEWAHRDVEHLATLLERLLGAL
jgi:DNA-binding MarR family transcriptional regulator